MSYSNTLSSASGTGSIANSGVMNAAQLIARLLFAYIFITAGYGKLMNHDGTAR